MHELLACCIHWLLRMMAADQNDVDMSVSTCCRMDLNAAQIVEQVIMARRLLTADAALLPANEAPTLTNVVSVAIAPNNAISTAKLETSS